MPDIFFLVACVWKFCVCNTYLALVSCHKGSFLVGLLTQTCYNITISREKIFSSFHSSRFGDVVIKMAQASGSKTEPECHPCEASLLSWCLRWEGICLGQETVGLCGVRPNGWGSERESGLIGNRFRCPLVSKGSKMAGMGYMKGCKWANTVAGTSSPWEDVHVLVGRGVSAGEGDLETERGWGLERQS